MRWISEVCVLVLGMCMLNFSFVVEIGIINSMMKFKIDFWASKCGYCRQFLVKC